VVSSKTVAICWKAGRFNCMKMYLGKLTLLSRIPEGYVKIQVVGDVSPVTVQSLYFPGDLPCELFGS
jgi:hypothetical protein